MAHISPSFRRAYRMAKRNGIGRTGNPRAGLSRPVSAWRNLSLPVKAAMGCSAAVLALMLLAPAHALNNENAPAQEDPAVANMAAPVETVSPPAEAQIGTTRPAARPERIASVQPTASNPATPKPEQMRGPVTRLPIPRYVSLKGDQGNVRRGPSLSHRIDWVFNHAGMPLRVVGEFGNWRRVEDRDGAGGWVHYQLISGVRTAIIQQDMVDLRSRPDLNAGVIARAEGGAVVRLGKCDLDWCRISGSGASGWVRKDTIWGVDPDEIRE
ncbi:SH3 domain-containing protein [Paracoccus aerodenitrificans]|uniref:SH3 domain-containing protein n=1 Tax=Paracoccus aerodenitrificans TaxID=3017781 RepID=UPI0022F016F6|nr:SH3 domain-containing protein [Paracoccus aerodenitrificans]WBU62757.1 SH3 domain-containing protein [Paracoccus aerodenitrificans]